MKLNLYTNNKHLIIGSAVFFLVKLAVISVGLWSKEGPRLGDDSFVYLYYGELGAENPLERPGPLSLAEMAPPEILENYDEKQRFLAYRVLMRTTQASRLFSLWPLQALPTENMTFYQAFWLYEIIVLVVVTIGITLMAKALNLKRLWLSLPLIALAMFPGQGIHFFIPSTLALGFGMMLWGLIFFEKSRPVILFLSALGALLSHTIGFGHLVIGGGLIFAKCLTGQRSLRRSGIEAVTMFLAIATFLLFISLMDTNFGFRYNFTRIGITPLLENVAGFPDELKLFAENDNMTALLCLVGTVLLFRRKSDWSCRVIPHDSTVLLGLGLLTMVGASSFYIIDGYPANVPFRFVTPFMILTLLALGDAWSWPPKKTTRRLIVGFSFLVLGANTLEHAMKNRDWRWPEIDRRQLASRITSVPVDSPILYFETDYALMAALMVGGLDRRAYVPPLLALDQKKSISILENNPPVAAVALMPRGMRTRSYVWWSLFEKARYGFDLRNNGTLSINIHEFMSELHVEWDGKELPSVNSLQNEKCAVERRNDGLISVSLACTDEASVKRIQITGDGFVAGLRVDNQRETLKWPWEKPLSLTFDPGRDGLWKPKSFETSFKLKEVLKSNMVNEVIDSKIGWDLSPVLNDISVLSDTGGILWFVFNKK